MCLLLLKQSPPSRLEPVTLAARETRNQVAGGAGCTEIHQGGLATPSIQSWLKNK